MYVLFTWRFACQVHFCRFVGLSVQQNGAPVFATSHYSMSVVGFSNFIPHYAKSLCSYFRMDFIIKTIFTSLVFVSLL